MAESSSVPPLPPRSPRVKFMLLDSLSTKALVASALAFFVSLVILVIVGAVGPYAALNREFAVSSTCFPLDNCTVTGSVDLPDMTPYNQATWVTVRILRPRLLATGQPVLPATEFRWTQGYTVSVTGDGNQLVDNLPHTTNAQCRPNDEQCFGIFLFAASHIYYSKFAVKVTLQSPLAAFAQFGASLDPTVRFVVRQGTIAEEYTTFEIGWKVFFIVITAIILGIYIGRLLTGPGSRDGLRRIIPNTTQQKWVLALGILLFFYNDPSFPTYITRPTLVLSGFYAVCSFTFLATLLLYWLVIFDLARIQGERGLTYDVDEVPSDPRERPGACFWVPKLILISIFWTISVASYMYVRIAQLTDPSYSITEAVGSQVVGWFSSFVTGIAAIYVLYFFGIVVLTCRNFRTLRPSNRFVVAVTIVALIIILAGLFVGSFTALRETSAAFLASAGVANLYVWALLLLHLPGTTAPWAAGMGELPSTELPQGGSGDAVTADDVEVADGGRAPGRRAAGGAKTVDVEEGEGEETANAGTGKASTAAPPAAAAHGRGAAAEDDEVGEPEEDQQPDRRRRASKLALPAGAPPASAPAAGGADFDFA